MLSISMAGMAAVGLVVGCNMIPAVFFKKNRKVILAGVLFFLLGMTCFSYTEKKAAVCQMEEGKQVVFQGKIKEEEVSDKGNYYTVEAVTLEGERIYVCIRILVVSEKRLLLGSRISGKGIVSPFSNASNPGEYDEESYQLERGRFLFLKDITINEILVPEIPIREILYQIRFYLAQIYDSLFEDSDASLAKAMVLGDKASLDADVKQLYQRNGIAHLIAISGLHIAMIGGALYHFLRRLFGSYPVAAGFGVLFIVLYGMMTGLSGSTVRAVIMLVVSIGAEVSGRRYDMPTAIAAALFLMLASNPYQITQVGFLLSFGAVIGITVVNPVWKHIFIKLPRCLDGLMVSVSVQIVLLPILLYYFYEIPLYGIFLNVAVVPAMSVLLAFLILCGIMGGFFLETAVLFVKPAQWIFELYERLCRFSEGLPFHTICAGRPPLIWIVCYYGVLLSFLGACYKKKKRVGFAAGGLLVALWIALFFPGRLTICMFDVGQGDGIYIRTPGNTHILMDGGSSSKQKVGAYVLKNGIKYYGGAKLDYVFVSHSDSDHYSGILELMEEPTVTIKNFILPAITNPDEAYTNLERKAKEEGCHIYYMRTGDKLQVDGVIFRCLSPGKKRYEDKNRGSLVIQMTYREFDMLFTGDMDEVVEKEILSRINGSIDVLKVAHHGSATASSEVFIQALLPDIACVSVGKRNRYGHPAKEVMNRLYQFCGEIYLTKDSGAITIDTDGSSYWIWPFLEEIP